MIPVTAMYAAVLACLLIGLSLRVVRLRRGRRVGLGDNGDVELALAVRCQANFTEYVPLALILIAAGELNGAPTWLVAGLGMVLVIARALHAWGLSRSSGASLGRVWGTALTWLVLIAGAIDIFVLGWMAA